MASLSAKNLTPAGQSLAPPAVLLRLPHNLILHEFGPLPGWYAIFVGAMRDRHRRYAYFEHFEPVEMLGYTVRIYHISVDDANRVRRKLGLPEIGTGTTGEALTSRDVAESKS